MCYSPYERVAKLEIGQQDLSRRVTALGRLEGSATQRLTALEERREKMTEQISGIAILESKLKKLEKRIAALEELTPNIDGWRTIK